MKRKIIFVIIAIVILSFSLYNFSIAAGEDICTVSIVPLSNNVTPGGQIELSVRISNIASGASVAHVGGFVDYNENIFNNISFEKVENWSQPSYAVKSFSIQTEDLSSVTTNQEVCRILLTVNPSVQDGNYEFKINTIDVWKKIPPEASDRIMFDNPVSTNITVKRATTTNNTVNNNTVVNNVVSNNTVSNNVISNNVVSNNVVSNNVVSNNVVSNNVVSNNVINNNVVNNTNNNVINTNSNSKNSDSTQSTLKLPNTGIKSFIVIIAGAAIIGAITAGIKYKKYNNIK